MKNNNTRRTFLKTSGIVSLGFIGLQNFACSAGTKGQEVAEGAIQVGYGKLKRDPEGILKLPEGFSYKIISRSGTPMSDGFVVPGKPDGMATFEGEGGRVIIVRNHEVSRDDAENGPFGKDYELLPNLEKSMIYEYGSGVTPGLGGTTTVIYNEETGEVEEEYLSLAGTIRNCAGGKTPWGSWVTCEETVEKAGGDVEKDHGYNFEVPALMKPGMAQPIPLKEMGRFNHEAISVDPNSGIVYQTEDRHDGLIYRYIPNVPGELAQGGKLQVLALKGKKSFDTRNWKRLKLDNPMPIGEKLPVEWLDIDEIDSPKDDLRIRGFENGAARFARGEGMWYGNDGVYFACTNGGKIEKGQIFRYTPSPKEGTTSENDQPGTLELFVEPNNTNIVNNCDNLTVAPWGDVVTCEDDEHPRIVGVKPDGSFYKLAENVGYSSEFAGGCFSPSGKTFFVNIQHAGLTVAITGPWV
ncbi:DUF839 domain-containing protein [Flammeovirgaceae bacterium SG7u.111]|nr:DUF839 domain-containing protein [Flammeovirgaceae bacterium SG7u.132]WPO38533.1 DUF839 domain-containing protein [Flammeovirgaceae bacterium SG7u.111]